MKMTKHYILAADDEPMNQMILEELLEDKYELVCVDDGTQCVESVKKRRPDLVLMDVNMPAMNGIEACREIKQLEGCADLPIIMVSALASDTEIEKGTADADSYITKPFNDDELLAELLRFLS